MSKDNGGPTSDRELLEMAAKAAGYELRWSAEGVAYADIRAPGYWAVWNPLADDGDALRLAAKLRIDVVFAHDEVCANLVTSTDCEYFEELYGDDRLSATRRAITRAAAAIGSAML